jgi:enolase
MPKISSLRARQILDSRGNPTIEVDCMLDDGSLGRASVPSGASTGKHEALELRDGDTGMYGGKSVHRAAQNVHTTIARKLVKMDVGSQRKIDEALLALDPDPRKVHLGANAILGVSMAVCRARAAQEEVPLWQSLAWQYETKESTLLPVPLMNVLNGGKHADSGLCFQECMIVPTDFSSFSDALRAGVETFHTLKKILSDSGQVTAVGDEGGFAPRLTRNREAFEILMRAIETAGYQGRIKLAIDAAASEFFADAVYRVDGNTHLHSDELLHYYRGFIEDFPIVSIEDSHAEDDWEGFIAMQKEFGNKVQLVGDDIFVTNVPRIQQGIARKAANAVLIKLNQIGTVSETVDAIRLANDAGWKTVVSHRSGETEDTFISHFAVGLRVPEIKTGSLSRTDRICKYNALIRIEEELGRKAEYRNPLS